ncbi:hypothetical protein [Protaetiibacter larvae]|uniref:Uncharacterized protein n=1 Tax=Protaetiibacter larvae TaxID=2592654 RepID=A0A5C1Y5B2_9MICO|nr:hypothetical protein [Protaetiibacter larvae]QEO08951.1 hypothetical protein FLP23_02320 [Protaetiibacter larvae]
MPWWVWVLCTTAAVALVALAQWRGWIELRGVDRGRGSGGGPFGIMDEVFHPTRHEAQQDLARQTVLPAPAPTPGDPPAELDAGRIRIVLSESAGTDTRDASRGSAR